MMRAKLFDVAEQHAIEIKKQDYGNYPVCRMGSGTWFGSVHAMVKVEPFKNWDGLETNYSHLENNYPFLKEKSNGVDMVKWFDKNTPNKIEGNEIEFTELIVQAVTPLGIDIGRIYKYKDKLGLISPEIDYLSYDLDKSLDFISEDIAKPIIGLKPGKGSIKQRAAVIVMPSKDTQEKIWNAIDRTKEEIEKLKGEQNV